MTPHHFVICIDEYGNDYPETAAEPAKEQNDVSKTSKAKKEDDESPKMMPVEDPDSETTSLVQSDPNDPDFIKNKGCKCTSLHDPLISHVSQCDVT